MSTPTILALDASSTTIGWVIYDADAARDCGEIALKGTDIADRCRQAHAALGLILANHPDVDVIAMEAPALRRFKTPDGRSVDTMNAVIPQCHVQGALMTVAALKQIHIISIEPATAKKALTGKGNCDKKAMQAEALRYGVTGEHAADALGVALASVGRVAVVGVAA